MKVTSTNLFYAFATFSILSSFMIAFVVTSQNPNLFVFPNWATYIAPTKVWAQLYGIFGGHWYVFGVSFLPVENCFIAIAFLPYLAYNFFVFAALTISTIGAILAYPFGIIPYPFNILWDTLTAVFVIGIIIFGITLFNSGLRNARGE